MKLFKRIKGKLLLIIMGSLLLLTLVSVVTTSRFTGSISGYDNVLDVTLEAEKLALQANLEFKRQVQEWKNTLIRGADASQMEKYWGRFNSRSDTTQSHIKKLQPLLAQRPELAKIATQFLKDHTAMKTAYSNGRDKYIAANFEIAVGDKAVSGIDRAPSAALDDLVDQLEIIGHEQTEQVRKAAHANILMSYGLIAAILVVVSLLALFVIDRILCKPLAIVRTGLSALASGNLVQSNDYFSEDELGDISESSRQLQSFLRGNVENMTTTSVSLKKAFEHMISMSDELRHHAVDQMSASDQVATAVQQMTHSATEVANNSQQTSQITQETSVKAKEGTHTTNSAQSSAVTLVADLNASAEVIKQLAENAANVSSVLDVIRGIAEQTNLLALNAAIEAARAGEQGRGFAVVADEVRTLAQRTQDSTSEIENILESVKSGADKAVIAMNAGQSRSKEVETDITAANNVLSEIAAMINEINNKNVQIASAAGEQTNVANEISTLIQNIHTLSESTETRVQESQQISGDLKDLVKQFEDQVSRFQL